MAAPPKPPPSPLDKVALAADTSAKLRESQASKAKGLMPRVLGFVGWATARANELFVLRVWNLYGRRRGPLLAAGNAYLMFFSVGAMLVAGFSIFGLIVADNQLLRDAVIDTVATTTPGLIDTGAGGLAKPEQLFGNGGFGLALIISIAALLVTSMGWINGLREGIRSILGLAQDRTNPILSKLRDALTLLILAVALIVTSGLGVFSTAAVDSISDWLGWGSFLSGLTARIGSLVVMFVLDVAVAIVMFSLAARVRLPRQVLLLAAVVAGAGATVLRFFSAQLLGGVSNNGLLAPFAVILGLFVWFYLLSQVYLICAAVAAVRAADVRHRTTSSAPSLPDA